MPPAQRESLDIERLLGDLRRKKRWLETLISGLEQAVQSPELPLIEAVQAVFEKEQMPRVDLADDEGSLLCALAAQVPRRGPGLERSASIGGEEAA